MVHSLDSNCISKSKFFIFLNKLLLSFIFLMAFTNTIPTNRTQRPDFADSDTAEINPFISNSMFFPILMGKLLVVSIVLAQGYALLGLCDLSFKDLSPFLCSLIVISNKDFNRMNLKTSNSQNRARQNGEKFKNANKKISRRENALEIEKDYSCSLEAMLLDTEQDLAKATEDIFSVNQELQAEKSKHIVAQTELTKAQQTLGLARDFLTANPDKKSHTSNRYPVEFCAQIVASFIISVTTAAALCRILRSLRQAGMLPYDAIIPCANTILGYAMQAGLNRLQSVSKLDEEYVLIIDHWIGKGSTKVFAALRLSKSSYQKALNENRALSLCDLELVAIEVQRNVNGPVVYNSLKKLFEKIGVPLGVLSDQGSDVNKSVKLYNELENGTIEQLHDLSHFAGNALKKQYTKDEEWFAEFLQNAALGSSKIRQSDYAEYEAISIRKKARWLNFSKPAKWAEALIKELIGPRKPNDKKHEKLQEAFGELIKQRDNILQFNQIIKVINSISKIFKVDGFSIKTANTCREILKTIDSSNVVRIKLEEWIGTHLEKLDRLQKKGWIESIPISSDSIESFFSRMKLLLEHGINEPSQAILIMPLMCGELTLKGIQDGLKKTSPDDVKKWLKENIPETTLKKRIKFLNASKEKKRAKSGGVKVSKPMLHQEYNLLKTGSG